MEGRILLALRAFALIAFASAGVAAAATPPSSQDATQSLARAQPRADVARLPLAFEPDRDGASAYFARGAGYRVQLSPTDALVQLSGTSSPPASVRMRLVGANARATLEGVERMRATSNYFIGADAAQWRTAVPNFAKVAANGVYPGIDIVYYGDGRQLEYDFVVAPRADPRRIALEFSGTERVALDTDGNLVLDTSTGRLVQRAPVVYQEIDGLRHPIDARFVLRGKRQVGFALARYDRDRPLIIDPVLVYATYHGGPGFDYGQRIAVDVHGNVYAVGASNGGLPVTPGAMQETFAGGQRDVFITKINPSGTERLYSTYLGGGGRESPNSVAVDTEGNAYVTGATSGGFPTTPGVFQPAPAGDTDWFVSKLSPDGATLVYSTYLGGPKVDSGNAIAVDGDGNAYVTGYAEGAFPVTPGAYQIANAGLADVVVAKLNPTGSALIYSTLIGGKAADNPLGIAIDGSGNAYIVGYTRDGTYPTTAGAYQRTYGGNDADVFVTQLNASGSALVYSTLIGGSGEENAVAIALDAGNNAYVTGWTTGNFPTSAGAYRTAFGGGDIDTFTLKLSASGSTLAYSTYLGVNTPDIESYDIALDGANNALLIGFTTGALPVTPDALQPTFAGAETDAHLTVLDATGSAIKYATFLGTTGDDFGAGIALDGLGNVHALVSAGAGGFATTPGVFQPNYGGSNGDALVLKLAELGVPRNYQGLWWRYPGGSEAGWGINFAHQGDVIFATWFTYDTNGKPLWFAAVLNRTAPGVFSGDVFTTTGPAFDAVPWDPATVTETTVGTMTVSFRDAHNATFSYTVNGVSQTKAITRQVYASPVPTCIFGALANLANATNNQDLWWKFPASSESGWGVNFTQQGDIIFFTWFTYGTDGKPTWLIAVAQKKNGDANLFEGPVSTVTGPSFDAVPWDPANVVETIVGSTTITFAGGNRATFEYTVNGVTQTKEITRQVFSTPGTACQ